ncbi:cTPxI [Tieghemiomyces parasiticus]|uniref:thioredoxin-dependent peroxiredoxin n=1 Tax=Tieghemiomyces parasiticus TaxID=78921 RepID=A0A9W7ZP23_9FUNG|nr:cTPxI [Tieghemiomyces parasiticus]
MRCHQLLNKATGLITRPAPTNSLTSAWRTQAARAPASVGSALRMSAARRAFATSSLVERSLVQRPAPAWQGQAVVDGDIRTLSLADYQEKYTVLVFYPADFTFVCPSELIAFSDRSAEFTALNTQVIGVSVDSEYSHLAWTQMPRNKGGLGDMKIPLLSDITKQISRDYDVLVEEAGVALRGLIIIDPAGHVRIHHVNDMPIGRSVDETLRLIEALQFHEQHGEVCPANWKKGAATIVPTPKGSQSYFSSNNK